MKSPDETQRIAGHVIAVQGMAERQRHGALDRDRPLLAR